MDEHTLPYLAGFIDGEGHIAVGISKSQKGERRWYLRFSCHQVNPSPLLVLKEAFGGAIHFTARQGTSRSLHEWTASSMDAYEAIKALRPWLIVKAEEADLAMQFQELLMARGTRRSPLTEAEQGQREAIYQALRAAKHEEYEREPSTFKVKREPKPKTPKKVRSKVAASIRGEWKKGKRPDRELLEAVYEVGGPAHVALSFGVSRQTVYNWLDAYQIPRLHGVGKMAAEARRRAALKAVWQ